jgi:hypothetical protein
MLIDKRPIQHLALLCFQRSSAFAIPLSAAASPPALTWK